MRFDQELRFAILNKRLIELDYKGRPRVVEPHDYGIQNGRVRLLAHQIAGESSTRLPGWRMLDVDRIDRVVVLEQEFRGSRGTFHSRHKDWEEVFARVQ
jgi:hypothetical protein